MFTWILGQPLTLERSGLGTVSGPTNGQLLELGKTYKLTAKPAAGWLFAGWSGSTNRDDATLNLVMRSNFTLRATFVTNSFVRLAGTWNGLAGESVPQPGHAGVYTAKLTPAGAASGKLLLGAAAISFKGQFKPDGTLSATMTTASREALRLRLAAPLDDPDGEMAGTLSGSNWTATVLAYRNPWTGKDPNTAPWQGSYLIP